MSASVHDLHDTLLRSIQAGTDSLTDDDAFNRLALDVFAHNTAAIPAYRAYCEARGRTPDTVTHWTEVPAVPTEAFKELSLHDDAPVARVFRTSGTTRGHERRGAHHVADLDLYRASLRPTFEAFLLPDESRPRMVSLMPPADAVPDSSLAFMISDVLHAFGNGRALVLADANGVDFDALDWSMDAAASDGEPVLLIGTSAAFIHWFDRIWELGRRFRLPEGSRVMDTGGYKGRGRRLEPEALRRAFESNLGLPGWAVVNEYGMTELLSQYYDTGLRQHVTGSQAPMRKRGPGWLRSVAVDPETLDPLPPGESGVLRHVDLANLHSVAAVQTEDVGSVDEDGLAVEGRPATAPPRGCSIAMDLLLENAP